MKIFCIIPAFNEAKHIARVIAKVKPLVDEVVVVDDGSTDNTFELAKAARAKVLRHFLNRGQGASLATGNQYSLKKGADILVHFDADGQFVAEEIREVVQPLLNKECEIVFGSRFLGKSSNMPLMKKKVIIPLARLFNKLASGSNLTDPQSGFRALSRAAAEKITINQDRMAHCSEIIVQAFRYKLKIKEAPITVIYRDFGQRFSGGLKIIKDLFLGRLISD